MFFILQKNKLFYGLEEGACMSIELSLLIAAVGTLVGVLGYLLNSKSNIKNDGAKDAQLSTKLEYISKGVDDIRIDLKANERQMQAFGERVTRVEESAKQAHKRIDKIEGEEK